MGFEKSLRVMPTDTDPYNIIHHPRYFVWIEEAVLEWLISDTGSLDGISYGIENFTCKFISSGVLYDELILRLNLRSRKKADGGEKYKFRVGITNKKTKKTLLEGDFLVGVSEKTDA